MSNWAERIKTEVGKAVIGQDIVIERMLVALLANGHVLLSLIHISEPTRPY